MNGGRNLPPLVAPLWRAALASVCYAAVSV